MSEEVPLPAVGSSVELHEIGGRTSLARVHSVDDGGITVVLPVDTAVTATAEPEWNFELTWSVPGAVAIVPVTIADRTDAAQIHLWRLATTGEVQRQQRRSDHRVHISGKVTITIYPDLGPRALPATQSDPKPLEGQLIDISPAAVQCVVRARSDDAVIHASTVATCEFALRDRPIVLRGTVLAAWTAPESDHVRVVLQFDAGQPALTDVVDYVGSAD